LVNIFLKNIMIYIDLNFNHLFKNRVIILEQISEFILKIQPPSTPVSNIFSSINSKLNLSLHFVYIGLLNLGVIYEFIIG
jgi:hypothetical protein